MVVQFRRSSQHHAPVDQNGQVASKRGTWLESPKRTERKSRCKFAEAPKIARASVGKRVLCTAYKHNCRFESCLEHNMGSLGFDCVSLQWKETFVKPITGNDYEYAMAA